MYPKGATITGFNDSKELVVLSVYPNPASDVIYVQIGLLNDSKYQVSLYNLHGKAVKRVVNTKSEPGIFNLGLDVQDVAPGTYILVFENNGRKVSRKVILK